MVETLGAVAAVIAAAGVLINLAWKWIERRDRLRDRAADICWAVSPEETARVTVLEPSQHMEKLGPGRWRGTSETSWRPTGGVDRGFLANCTRPAGHPPPHEFFDRDGPAVYVWFGPRS